MGQFLLVEVGRGLGVDVVGDAAVGHQGHRLREGEGRLFLLGEEVAGLAPDGDHVQPVLALAGLAGVVGVHVQAVRAVVEVGGADLDQFDEGGVQTLAGGGVEADQGAEDLRGGLAKFSRAARSRSGGRGSLCVVMGPSTYGPERPSVGCISMAESWVNYAERIGADLHLELVRPGQAAGRADPGAAGGRTQWAARPRHPAAAVPLARRRPRRRPQHGRRRLRRTRRGGLAHRPPGLGHPGRRAGRAARPAVSARRSVSTPRRRPHARVAHATTCGRAPRTRPPFPRTAWLASYRRALHQAPNEVFGPGDPAGRVELREALAEYLARARGVRTEPDRIVICSGFAHALRLLFGRRGGGGGVLRGPLAVEAYGLAFHRSSSTPPACGPYRSPWTNTGARVDRLGRERAVLLTPAHQFPTGGPAACRTPGRGRRLGTRAWRGGRSRTTTTGSSATTASPSAPSRASTPSG